MSDKSADYGSTFTSGRISKSRQRSRLVKSIMGSSSFAVRGMRASNRIVKGGQLGVLTRSSGVPLVDPTTLELVEFKKRRLSRGLPGIPLWVPQIPFESGLRSKKFRQITSTIIWPDKSTLNAEAAFFSHFVSSASEISGWAPLCKKRILNSVHGTFYNCIVRYKDGLHRLAALYQQRHNRLVHNYLAHQNVTVSSAAIDIRYYMSRYNLPFTVLVGEGQTWRRNPHCTCLVFRYYNNAWQAVIKDSKNVGNMDVGPVTKYLLKSLGFKVAYFVSLSERDSNRLSINCVGHGMQAAATVLDGRMEDLMKSVPVTAIWRYDLINNCFLDNNLQGIPFVKKFMPTLQSVRVKDSAEIRSRLVGFRERVTEIGAELWKTVLPEEEEVYFEVSSLNGRRTINGTFYYLVSWLGYGEEAHSWEPLKNLESCKDVVMEFDADYEEMLKVTPTRGRRLRGNHLTLEQLKPSWFDY